VADLERPENGVVHLQNRQQVNTRQQGVAETICNKGDEDREIVKKCVCVDEMCSCSVIKG
jgi:hypothetical protein